MSGVGHAPMLEDPASLAVLVLPHLELNEHLHTKPVPTP